MRLETDRLIEPSPTMSTYQDLFSDHAACYARARPSYPRDLLAFVCGLAPARRLAWDCATGNGQAAFGLAGFFDRVIATDACEAQLAHAPAHDRIVYRVMSAEGCDLPAASVDLITVAQALHWLDLDAFYAQVRRVARPDGVLAVWCYSLHHVSDDVDRISRRLYNEITGPYWHARRRLVDERYETIPFPFDEIRGVPTFQCLRHWTLPEYVAYLESWSAVQQFRHVRGSDPLHEIAAELSAAWGPPQQVRAVTWPIHLRIGRVGPSGVS